MKAILVSPEARILRVIGVWMSLCFFALAAGLNYIDLTQGRKIALVIGNGNYKFQDGTPNAINDAEDISNVLRKSGFEVDVFQDASFDTFGLAVDKFEARSRGADVALFFYAGHGVEIDGKNYLLPIGIQANNDSALKRNSICANAIHDFMTSNAKLSVIILDACRDRPGATRGFGKRGAGLAAMQGGTNPSMIAFATSPGEGSFDGEQGRERNGLYTGQLLKAIQDGGSITEILQNAEIRTKKVSNNQQRPWLNASSGEYTFQIASKLQSAGNDQINRVQNVETAVTLTPSFLGDRRQKTGVGFTTEGIAVGGVKPYTFEWFVGNERTGVTEAKKQWIFNQPGSYPIRVVVRDSSGNTAECVDTVSVAGDSSGASDFVLLCGAGLNQQQANDLAIRLRSENWDILGVKLDNASGGWCVEVGPYSTREKAAFALTGLTLARRGPVRVEKRAR